MDASDVEVVIITTLADDFDAMIEACRAISRTPTHQRVIPYADTTSLGFHATLNHTGTEQHVIVLYVRNVVAPITEAHVTQRPPYIAFFGTCVSAQPGRTGRRVAVQPGDVVVASDIFGQDAGSAASYTLRDDWRRAALSMANSEAAPGILTGITLAPPPSLRRDHPTEWNSAGTPALDRRSGLGRTRGHDAALTESGAASQRQSMQLNEENRLQRPPFRVHVGPIATLVGSRTSEGVAGIDVYGGLGRAAAWMGSNVPFDIVVMSVAGPRAADNEVDAANAAGWLLRFLSEQMALEKASFDKVVAPGTASLPELERLRATPSLLMQARHTVVPFQGQEDVVATLIEWAQLGRTAAPVALALVHGAGGVGKTRLAIELCHTLRNHGHLAGFLTSSFPDDALLQLLALRGARPRPRSLTLIVDDADCQPQLASLLEALQVVAAMWKPGDIHVVLLARTAGTWFEACKTASNGRLRTLFNAATVLALAELAANQEDRAMQFRIAMDAFGKLLGMDTAAQTTPRPPPLDDQRFGRILYVHMAALDVLLHQAATADSLINALLEHEVHRWYLFLKYKARTGTLGRTTVGTALRDLMRLQAAVTWRGGCRSRVEAATTCGTVVHADEQLDDALTFLSRAYPARDGGFLAPLQPDVLGEALVYRSLIVDVAELHPRRADAGAATPDATSLRRRLAERLFGDNDERALTSAFEMLARLSAHHPAVAPWAVALLELDVVTRALVAVRAILATVNADSTDVRWRAVDTQLGAIVAAVLERHGTATDASVIIQLLPRQTVAFREIAEWAARTIATEPTRSSKEQGAHALLELSFRQSQLGRSEDSLQSAREAVALAAALASDWDTVPFRELLARCLVALAGQQRDHGRMDEATETAMQSLQLWRELARMAPTPERLHEMAESLLLLGALETELGHHDAAQALALEAANLCRRRDIQQQWPDLLAACLLWLGRVERSIGQTAHALELVQEAVSIIRTLAQQCPDAVAAIVASAMSQLGLAQSSLGRHNEAVLSNEEAVDLYRRLARRLPDKYYPKLASVLSNLANEYDVLGASERALKLTTEALELDRRLAQLRPAAYRPGLAASLTNLAIRYKSLGRPVDALVSAQEAVHIYTDLARNQSDAYMPDLATSLTTLAAMQSTLGRRAEALVSMKQVVQVHRLLASKRRGVYMPALAVSLNNLCVCQLQTGDGQAALGSALEATMISRTLLEASATPRDAANAVRLASSLECLGRALLATGQPAASERAYQDAIGLVEQFANPDGVSSSESSTRAVAADLLRSLRRRLDHVASLPRQQEQASTCSTQ